MRPVLQIAVIDGALPDTFDVLRAEARIEEYRFLDRLATDWTAGALRFDRRVVGVGGVTLDPVTPGALRMRRFYIHPAFRRQGIAQRLATTLLDHPSRAGRVITVNAGTADAPAFWEALGFTSDLRDGHTHMRRLPPPWRPSRGTALPECRARVRNSVINGRNARFLVL